MRDQAPPPRRRRASAYGRGVDPITPAPRERHRVRTAMLVLLGFLVAGGLGVFSYYATTVVEAFGIFGQTTTPTVATPSGQAVPTSAALAQTAAPAPNQPFTMLLLGSDNDAKTGGGPVLTQSMILARVDPVNKKVTMLSIPRDLYVQLSTGQTDKIDKAYLFGGANAAIATVENNFGVHIDHYAWIGLQGLVNLIDKVGGVDVVASNPVLDDYYPADLSGSNPYAYERVAVLPGAQHMSGSEALQYVRSRHGDLRGDFGRSFRQQQVLLALRAKAKLLGFADVPDIAGAIQSDFKTDVAVTEMGSLLPLAGSIPLANVTQVVLLPPYTTATTIGEQDVLLPNWDLIRHEVSQDFPS